MKKCPVRCSVSGGSAMSAYRHSKCRCDECRLAHSAYMTRYRVDQVLYHAKGRALKRGVPFTIRKEDVPAIPETCPALGIVLQVMKGMRGMRPDSPSLDCIDPELGYVPGNVQWLSLKANAMKRDATPAELKRFARWVLS